MVDLAVPLDSSSDDRYMRKDALPYTLLSYKGRRIDLSKPVEVYRNLREPRGFYWSIRQDSLVVAHADELMLKQAKFVVNETGRQRVLRTGRKNVHAWIRGYLIGSGMGTSADDPEPLPAIIEYNPRRYTSFVTSLTSPPSPVKAAWVVKLRRNEVSGAYL